MRRVLDVVSLMGQPRVQGYGMRMNPTWKLGRFNGEVVLLGKNQAVKMLIQAPLKTPRDRATGVRDDMDRA
jgi:hypothetical protein